MVERLAEVRVVRLQPEIGRDVEEPRRTGGAVEKEATQTRGCTARFELQQVVGHDDRFPPDW